MYFRGWLIHGHSSEWQIVQAGWGLCRRNTPELVNLVDLLAAFDIGQEAFDTGIDSNVSLVGKVGHTWRSESTHACEHLRLWIGSIDDLVHGRGDHAEILVGEVDVVFEVAASHLLFRYVSALALSTPSLPLTSSIS